LTETAAKDAVFSFNRKARFGFHDALSYEIVVNWMIAEHKSQGLFQTECGQYSSENFWVFRVSGAQAWERAERMFQGLAPEVKAAAPVGQLAGRVR
jgi:hypothetical protein